MTFQFTRRTLGFFLLAATLSRVPSLNGFTLQHRALLGWRKPLSTRRQGFSLRSGSDDKNENDDAAIPNEWQGQVLQQLKSVIDPDLGSDIVTLGFVQNLKLDGRTISFDVELTTPACPVKDQFAADCEFLVSSLPWVSEVQVTMTAQEQPQQQELVNSMLAGLSQVGAIIAVSSCKGGVGKSTTAVNLAFSLQALGGTVGILDADVFGPSLPTMVTPDDDIVRFVGRQIAPLQRNGVRLMSFGHVNDGSAVMRGPMVSQLLDQFLSVTNWGALDYLILDMPPGTGDVQLTLTQRLNITAAVIVTTPQELSFVDVVRGVEMFDSVQVPCVAVVENMAYYQAPDPEPLNEAPLKHAIAEKLKAGSFVLNGAGDKVENLAEELVKVVADQLAEQDGHERKVPIFGPGHKERLSKQWGMDHTFSMPLMADISANGDKGTPFVLENPDSAPAQTYRELAQAVVSEVAKIKFAGGKYSRPAIEYEGDAHIIRVAFQTKGGESEVDCMTTATLRRACRCASCVEELTGRQLLIPSQVSEDIKPLRMYPTGNYALSVDWSDGHRSLYPYRQVKDILDSQRKVTKEEAQLSSV